MDKNKKAIIVIGVIAGVAICIWYVTKSKVVVKDKTYWVNNIVSYTTKVTGTSNAASASVLNGFDSGYLQAWSDSIDAGSMSFVYNSKNYSTDTGTAV